MNVVSCCQLGGVCVWDAIIAESAHESAKLLLQDSPAAVESAPLNAAGCCEVHFRRLDDPLMLHR